MEVLSRSELSFKEGFALPGRELPKARDVLGCVSQSLSCKRPGSALGSLAMTSSFCSEGCCCLSGLLLSVMVTLRGLAGGDGTGDKTQSSLLGAGAESIYYDPFYARALDVCL